MDNMTYAYEVDKDVIGRAKVLVTGTSPKGWRVYIEVSCDMDYDTLHPKEWRGEVDYDCRLLSHPGDSLARWVTSRVTDYISQEAYDLAKLKLIESISHQRQEILRGRESDLYKAMEEVSKGHLKHYKSDMNVHDARMIARDEVKTGSIWIVRESGTWLLTPKNRDFWINLVDSKTLDYDSKYFYVTVNPIMGKHLRQVTYQNVCDLFNYWGKGRLYNG